MIKIVITKAVRVCDTPRPECGAFTHAKYDSSGKADPTCYLKFSCNPGLGFSFSCGNAFQVNVMAIQRRTSYLLLTYLSHNRGIADV